MRSLKHATVSAALVAGSILLAIVSSAAMLVLSLPLGDKPFLAWFALVPVLRLVRLRGFLTAFSASLTVIFVAAYLSISGLFYTVHSLNGTSSWVYTGFGIFGFSVCLGIGAWGDKDSKNLPIWWFAGLAVLLEAYLLVQLPAHLALTQYKNPLILQIAAVGGVWLVSFLLWMSNFYLSTLSARKLIGAVCLIVPCALLTQKFHFSVPGRQEQIAVVQIGEPEVNALKRLHLLASRSKPDFVVWPEFAGIPFISQGDLKRLEQFSAEPGTAPIITSFPDAHAPLPHNTSALFINGSASRFYWKRKLFGAETKMHEPGTSAIAVPFKGGVVGLNVCFDSCYPETIRDTAMLPNVNLLSLPSIDPESTNNFIAAIHASYTPFRAAEEGVSMVKADGFAYSIFVDPYGQIIRELPPGDREDTESVPVTTHWTPYKQFGDWFLYLIGLGVCVRLALEMRQISREKKQSQRKSGCLPLKRKTVAF